MSYLSDKSGHLQLSRNILHPLSRLCSLYLSSKRSQSKVGFDFYLNHKCSIVFSVLRNLKIVVFFFSAKSNSCVFSTLNFPLLILMITLNPNITICIISDTLFWDPYLSGMIKTFLKNPLNMTWSMFCCPVVDYKVTRGSRGIFFFLISKWLPLWHIWRENLSLFIVRKTHQLFIL